jgi:uncharacterized protein
MATELIDNPQASRYELLVDGTLAGVIEYQIHNGRISLVHTEIRDEYEGHGLGGQLAKAALNDVRERGLELVPLCPFIASYIRKHPDQYLQLVTPSYRDKLTQPTQGVDSQ